MLQATEEEKVIVLFSKVKLIWCKGSQIEGSEKFTNFEKVATETTGQRYLVKINLLR
mgnify:CR=1 FL=1